MAQFTQAVITQKGLELNAKIQAGVCQAAFTRAAIGNGIWTPAAGQTIRGMLYLAEDLASEKMTVSFTSITVVQSDKVLLESAFNNANVVTRFNITELGLYATDPDEGEILYSISICEEGDADLMPAGTGGSITFVYKNYISIWDAASVTIETSGAFALAEDVGSIGSLTTEDRSSVVNAVNELDYKARVLNGNTRLYNVDWVSGIVSFPTAADGSADDENATVLTDDGGNILITEKHFKFI